MNNPHDEAERILSLVEQLKAGSADEKLQAQIIERALIRAYEEGAKAVKAADKPSRLQAIWTALENSHDR